MFPTLIKQLIHITERQNRLLLALLCPLFLSAMTTEEGKKKKRLRPIHVSVPKSWKPQLRWLECQAFPPLQYVTVSTSQRSKAHLSFQYILFFYLFIKSRMCFLCPPKISCQCQTCLTFKILIHSFIETEILAYVSDKSFKFQHLKLCRLVCHYDNNFYMSLEQSWSYKSTICSFPNRS